MSQQLSRRQFGALALTGIGTTFLLAGCGTSAPTGGGATTTAAAGDAFKKSTLTLAWWTNPLRTQYTGTIVTNFTTAHPKVTVTQAPGEWATYWTKLSTQVAAQTAPDIIQMDQAYIAEYGGRGALLDMSNVGSIDTAPLKSSLAAGTQGGKLYGIPAGNTVYSVFANKSLFEKAGVDLPDDKTWTWDDYIALSTKLAKASGGAFTGTSWYGADQDLQIWLHQHGQQLYTDKGKLAFTADGVASWFTMVKKLFASGGGPTADQYTNDIASSVQQELFGTSKSAMGWHWNSQLTALAQANGGDLVLLRPPSSSGSAKKNGLYLKPSMYWSMSAQTKYPAQAGGLINVFLNDTSAAKLQLIDRGIPTNEKVLETITPLLAKTDQLAIAYMQNVTSEISWVPPVPPKGTSTVAQVAQRHTQDVIFNRATPADAAAAFKSEVQSLLDTNS
ncbi:extracellular solute-binding protein [Planctomonas sp. JC2975]|uniref:ABC transporter substrate-binding protein n=1 Tax=Planctomonas sp. JC2975 TaxID=2729626 RepID=UPI001475C6C7|nr:extracellular solute-binding protein [Planctomonas sp. JC2975]NNC13901.1 extracellular solute-binding protein [Planctomonas sp. JC2975]